LKDIKSFAYGDYKIEFQEKIQELETVAKDNQAIAAGIQKSKSGKTRIQKVYP